MIQVLSIISGQVTTNSPHRSEHPSPSPSIMTEEAQGKWEGKATVELKGPTADQVWPFLEDFCNLQKWLPGVDTCYQVEGELGQPGLVRYCSSGTASSDGSHEGNKVIWAKEKLIMINPSERCLSYEILENNAGFKSYVATMKALPINDGDGDGDGDGQHGCKIEWSFIADPVEGWPLEDFNSYINSSLQFMGQKMEQAVLSG
ncbi:lachrymatory-factor synthase [Populus alba]|nr:lachrymatory-factor synthase-like [Populus alba]